MRTSAFRFASVFALVVMMLCSAASAEAANPYMRARKRGRHSIHRPVYKQYQPSGRKGSLLVRLLS